MIHHTALSEDFFKLKTKVAGNIIQKFISYNIKTAVIVPEKTIQKSRFKEIAMEINKGSDFRIYENKYENKKEAEEWFLK